MRGESIVFLVYWQKGSKPLDRFVVFRALDKREYLMIIFLISHPNHML